MNKTTAIVYPGMPYRHSILYGAQRAAELKTSFTVAGIIPELSLSELTALHIYEFATAGSVTNKMEAEAREFFETVKEFCSKEGIVANFCMYRGGIEDVVDFIRNTEKEVSLLIVPTPTKSINQIVSPSSAERRVHYSSEPVSTGCPLVLVLDR
ncbi:MAG: hypothetical protein HQK88_08580 [Nitrospirae bacterium]|nr:hypothetical protein [Nitrospirota bacterium]MBF0536121.1 hypothetical protein [Nitrospirota bacterium]MBF0616857.1 hypothetical protein [Nitrospirota bacterium]